MNTTGSGIAHKKERNFEREKKKLKEIEKYFALILCSSRTNNNNRIGNNKNKK